MPNLISVYSSTSISIASASLTYVDSSRLNRSLTANVDRVKIGNDEALALDKGKKKDTPAAEGQKEQRGSQALTTTRWRE